MEKYGQYRDKGTYCMHALLFDERPLTHILHVASGVAPFFPVPPPSSNPLLLPWYFVRTSLLWLIVDLPSNASCSFCSACAYHWLHSHGLSGSPSCNGRQPVEYCEKRISGASWGYLESGGLICVSMVFAEGETACRVWRCIR
jgi:hypothetical protein